MEIPDGKGRLGWFDALRGTSMILVVFGHVLYFSLGVENYDSVLSSTILTFRMPLFFLVSGFFAYRVCERWTTALVGDIVKRKVQAQIICTIIFFALFQFCHGENAFSWISNGFGGYWFTIVLFQAFVVFLALSLLSKLFKSERILVVGLLIIAIVSIFTLATTPPQVREDSTLWKVPCLENVCKYFQFFALGIFCRKYRELFETVLSKNWFKAGITTCAIACWALYYHDGFRSNGGLLYDFIHDIAIRYAMLLVVVAFFFTKREFFEKQNATSSCLRYVGRRTLDIYMIHYFFLPDLSALKEWLFPGNMFIFQLFLGLSVSLAIIAVCLLISEILRMSDFLSAWLFGVKSQQY